jgi:hypothetical protein
MAFAHTPTIYYSDNPRFRCKTSTCAEPERRRGQLHPLVRLCESRMSPLPIRIVGVVDRHIPQAAAA